MICALIYGYYNIRLGTQRFLHLLILLVFSTENSYKKITFPEGYFVICWEILFHYKNMLSEKQLKNCLMSSTITINTNARIQFIVSHDAS